MADMTKCHEIPRQIERRYIPSLAFQRHNVMNLITVGYFNPTVGTLEVLPLDTPIPSRLPKEMLVIFCHVTIAVMAVAGFRFFVKFPTTPEAMPWAFISRED